MIHFCRYVSQFFNSVKSLINNDWHGLENMRSILKWSQFQFCLWKFLIMWWSWLESEVSFLQHTFYKRSGCKDKNFFHYKSIRTWNAFLCQHSVAFRHILSLRSSEHSHSVLSLSSKTVTKIKPQQLKVFFMVQRGHFQESPEM